MPLYEYACKDCGKRFEVLQPMGADASTVGCPHCGSRTVAKQLSTFASSVSSGSGSALPCGASSSAGCGSGGFT